MKMKESKPATKRLLSIQEVKEAYGGTVWFWRSQIWARRIPVVQVGKKQWLDTKDLEKFISDNKRGLP